MKKAFTLAEILITLGIIGVVAAMTIPNVMTNIRHKDTSAKLKKFYATMKQVIVSAEDEFGPVNDWDMNLPAKDFVNTYFSPYLKFSLDEKRSTNSQPIIYFTDGSRLQIRKGRCMDMTFDVNGLSKPNQFGYDQFVFLACDKSITEWCAEEGFCAYRYSSMKKENSREKFLAKCKELPYFCSGLLEYDNWEFLKDYPY